MYLNIVMTKLHFKLFWQDWFGKNYHDNDYVNETLHAVVKNSVINDNYNDHDLPKSVMTA